MNSRLHVPYTRCVVPFDSSFPRISPCKVLLVVLLFLHLSSKSLVILSIPGLFVSQSLHFHSTSVTFTGQCGLVTRSLWLPLHSQKSRDVALSPAASHPPVLYPRDYCDSPQFPVHQASSVLPAGSQARLFSHLPFTRRHLSFSVAPTLFCSAVCVDECRCHQGVLFTLNGKVWHHTLQNH